MTAARPARPRAPGAGAPRPPRCTTPRRRALPLCTFLAYLPAPTCVAAGTASPQPRLLYANANEICRTIADTGAHSLGGSAAQGCMRSKAGWRRRARGCLGSPAVGVDSTWGEARQRWRGWRCARSRRRRARPSPASLPASLRAASLNLFAAPPAVQLRLPVKKKLARTTQPTNPNRFSNLGSWAVNHRWSPPTYISQHFLGFCSSRNAGQHNDFQDVGR